MSDKIPEEVKNFVVRYIDSIAEMEAMLFLRSHRDRDWSAGSVADWIYASEEVSDTVLARLTENGFITSEGMPVRYQYGPRNQELARMLDQVAEAYSKYLVPVTEIVHKKSRRNIEGLAQAFEFKKKT
ncbi:MAG: hypothetical protein ACREJN_07950 [Nitrospiraceae bacterium]